MRTRVVGITSIIAASVAALCIGNTQALAMAGSGSSGPYVLPQWPSTFYPATLLPTERDLPYSEATAYGVGVLATPGYFARNEPVSLHLKVYGTAQECDFLSTPGGWQDFCATSVNGDQLAKCGGAGTPLQINEDTTWSSRDGFDFANSGVTVEWNDLTNGQFPKGSFAVDGWVTDGPHTATLPCTVVIPGCLTSGSDSTSAGVRVDCMAERAELTNAAPAVGASGIALGLATSDTAAIGGVGVEFGADTLTLAASVGKTGMTLGAASRSSGAGIAGLGVGARR